MTCDSHLAACLHALGTIIIGISIGISLLTKEVVAACIRKTQDRDRDRDTERPEASMSRRKKREPAQSTATTNESTHASAKRSGPSSSTHLCLRMRMRSPSRPACGEGGSAIVYLRIIEWSGIEAMHVCVPVCDMLRMCERKCGCVGERRIGRGISR